jgi:type I restriction enzyme R subunit
MKIDYSEDTLVEQPTIKLFAELGWETVNCYEETFGPEGSLGREISNEVILLSRLHPVLKYLNPELPLEAYQIAINEIIRDRSLMSSVRANQEVYDLLRNGIKVTFRDSEGVEVTETVRVIDWEKPANNDFFIASQFWVTGDLFKRRPDLVGFVNGIPLILVELKAPDKNIKDAFDDNLRDYKNTIPQLFWYNTFVIVSNGDDARVGSFTSPWGHFAEWKKINTEGEQGIVSLETLVRATCEPVRLLDIVENFILYVEGGRGLYKIIAKNHQYLGVNNAIEALKQIKENQGQLGVFWHTQGSGKSYSMIFFSQKALRKLPGNWTFVVITDRKELDEQIYKNFAGAGVVIEPESRVRAESGEHLKQLLTEDRRYVFTLIHKFHTGRGERYPTLSERSDIIVMTDEAHRTQYDILALNMRNALPNAAFLAFTGTPLIVTEEKTKGVFGDYVSIYNFRDSVEDRATVPLYYENRKPKLQLSNEQFNEDMERLLEDLELNPDQEAKLGRIFRNEYYLITREDRLEEIGEDIVEHFMGRGFTGKAMVVCVDKATAVRMYDKVKKYWGIYLDNLEQQLAGADEFGREMLERKIQFMEETDMAVVVSQSQNEVEDLAKKGADIVPHRTRMIKEDLSTKFKDPDDNFRIVFVCAMWMTGFDAPACSTIYLDKPMRNHTLMQTIARANRVWGEKVNGLIVDYIGIFRNLQKALAIYGSGAGGGIHPGEKPVFNKEDLVEDLREAIEEAKEYCLNHGVNLKAIQKAEGFERVRLISDAAILLGGEPALEDAVDALLVNDDVKQEFLSHANYVNRLFRAILPDPAANEFGPDRKALVVIADKIRSLAPEVDISEALDRVEDLLDDSIRSFDIIKEKPKVPYSAEGLLDLSQIDFDALWEQFQQSRKHIEAERLRGKLNVKLQQMVRLNQMRMNFMEEFQRLIDEYNAGDIDVDVFFEKLLQFSQRLGEEERRGITEQLTEEELAVFDLLTKPRIELTEEEIQQVKDVARDLLDTLKAERLVLDWRKKQQTRAGVRLTIEQILDQLPAPFVKDLYKEKCDRIYQHVYDSYYGAGQSIYPIAA